MIPRLIAALMLAAAATGRGAPVISEFIAANASGLVDAAGRRPDWIEIYNPDAAPVNMAGWHLTDDAAEKTKWTFPAVTIAGGARLVVFASGDGVPDAGGALHTNFSLNAAGEYLALVHPGGVTASTEYAPAFPPQREDVSYGVSRSRTSLLAPGSQGKMIAPSAAITGEWRGGSEPFNDVAWTTVTNGIGYNLSGTAIIPENSPPCAAYAVPAGTVGSQNFGGSLGMDFSAESPLTVTALGAFDSGSDGFQSTIRVQLWTRNENATPENFADDTGQAILADVEFTPASQGVAEGGSRFKNLPAPLTLPVGAYTIVAWGYSDLELNGNAGIGAASWTVCSTGGGITFDGAGRYHVTPGAFPTSLDGGPPNRYAAGTFKYSTAPADLRHTAYRVTSGQAGNQDYGGPLGMDFVVLKPVRVASLGAFDDGSNGIAAGTTITTQLWRRNDNGTPSVPGDDSGIQVLAAQTFTAASGGDLEGGSRFKPLAAPVELTPGAYTIVAWGYGAAERNGNSTAPPWTTDAGAASLQFVGTSRYGFTGGSFPNVPDSSPANRYAAGTFQYFDGSDPMIASDVGAALRNIAPGAWLRFPFTANPADFSSLELEMASDDGFSAWINGTPTAARNAPAALTSASTATQAGAFVEVYTLPATLLRTGANMAAVHGLNVSAGDNDFLQRVRLTGISSTAVPHYFPEPTPGAPESTGVDGFMEPVSFSVPHGFYDAPFAVALSTTSPQAEIRYTTDGSAPVESSALYTAPLSIASTTVLRAATFRSGYAPSVSVTQSYLFADQIVAQNNTPAGYPASWNAIAADYAMEDSAADLAAILGQPAGTPLATLRAQIKASLLTLPALSIVTEKAALFDSATGIYTNPSGRGDLWEKPCSAELLPQPGNAEAGFQINGGLQVMGLTSRNLLNNPRLPLRVIFSRRFGPPSLDYPLFPGNPVTRFDSIALRGNTRDTFGNDGNATYIRDQWTKQMQAAMGVPASSGRFMHVFLNGIYWGIYNPTERPDGDFCQEHLGGPADEWDSITLCCPNRVKSGSITKWQELMTLCNQGFETDAKYQFLMGNNPDGTRNPAYEVILDIDNLIAFLVSGYYHASGDWPGNFYALRRRGPQSTGWKFVTWDSDIGLGWGNAGADKTALDAGVWWTNSPGQIDLALRAHPEYRMRLADAVQRHFFNGGVCTPANAAARWTQITQSLQPAMAAECARWGDYLSPLSTVARWQTNTNAYTASWFPNRTATVLSQLRARGLFPSVSAPVFNQHGGAAPPGFALSMSGPGTVYFTLNGDDPRLPGGAVRAGLVPYTTPVALNATTTVKARTLSGGVWSALAEASFLISPPASAATLVVSELHYNPAGPDDAEFIEVMNVSAGSLDLSGVSFTAGVQFTFAAGTVLAPGARMVVVRDPVAFTALYGPGIAIAGSFQNLTNLDNGGELITLLAANGNVIASFTYGDSAPWPEADGTGYSLTLIHPHSLPDPALPANWRTSTATNGSPATSDATVFTGNPAADADGDGLSARLEYALGTSDTDPASGPASLQWDATSGTAKLRRALAADDAVPLLEASPDLTAWSANWPLTLRERLPDGTESLHFTAPANSPARVFLRARVP